MKQKLITTVVFLTIALLLLISSKHMTFQYGDTVEQLDEELQWQFFSKQWVAPSEAAVFYGKGTNITIPHQFKEQYGTPEGFGTYIAKLTLPERFVHTPISLFIPFQYGSYELYINDTLVMQQGVLGTTASTSRMQTGPKLGEILLDTNEVYITIQLANYASTRGGLAKAIQLGPTDSMQSQLNMSIVTYFFIIGAIFILAFFLLFISLSVKKQHMLYTMTAICFVLTIRSFFARPFFYSFLSPTAPWLVAVKIESIMTMLALLLFVRLCEQLMAPYIRQRFFYAAYSILAVYIAIICMSEPLFYQQLFLLVFVAHFYYAPYCVYVFYRNRHELTFEHKLQFTSMLCLGAVCVHDVYVVIALANRPMLIQLAIISHALLQLYILTRQYVMKDRQVQTLWTNITLLHDTLEQQVALRTQTLAEENKQLQAMAIQDALTGIGNRHLFEESLAQALQQWQPHQPVTLLLIDLDYFKQYNDCYGHQAGDELLQHVTSILQKHLPPSAIFTRYGGEEFAVLLADDVDYVVLCETLVTAIAEKRYPHKGSSCGFVTISLGGYTMNAQRLLESQLIQAADKQLYKAKHHGKNQFFYTQQSTLCSI